MALKPKNPIRQSRLENMNKKKLSSKLEGSYKSFDTKNSPKVKYSKETTYKEKNAAGNSVKKERIVNPQSGGSVEVTKKRIVGKANGDQRGKVTTKTYDSTTGKLMSKGKTTFKSNPNSTGTGYDTKSKLKQGKSVIVKKNDVVTKSTGIFNPSKEKFDKYRSK